MAIKPSSQYTLSYNDQKLWERGDISLQDVKESPRTPREVRRKVRAMIHNLKRGQGLHEGESFNHLII